MTKTNLRIQQNRKPRLIKAFVCALLILAFLWALASSSIFYANGSERFFSGEAQEYYEELIEKGFPSDYALRLTELHLLHPTWEFEPLLITEAKSTYTWQYVIQQESADPTEPDRNLVSAKNDYLLYRHPINLELYDSGYYQASQATVEYFMDPRNFLNETDIFQFFDLSNHTSASSQSVNAVLENTFMEGAYLENGKTYSKYFLEVGEELGINPLYLAVKVRQEQGVAGTSPIISGTCGTLLADYYINKTQVSSSGKEVNTPLTGYDASELRKFNGHYNYFNVSASGDGLFAIYHGAMTRAAKGTENMSAEWGGSPAWNTRWKSIYGGAYSLKTSYIDRYQQTVYLQKFNVDSRAGNRNFWAQYMQNVSGAMSEARMLYQSFASIGALDTACSFLIPVYEGMPAKPCADPGLGMCSAFLTANHKYHYEITLSDPDKLSATSSPIYQTKQAIYGTPLVFTGSVSHSYGLKNLEYRLDNGEWVSIGTDEKFNFSISTDFSEGTTHILVIRGQSEYDSSDSSKKNNAHFLCGVFYLQAVRPDVTLTLKNGETTEDVTVKAGDDVMLPTCRDADFVGWMDSNGSLLPSGATVTLTQNLECTALYLSFEHLQGAALSLKAPAPTLRFSAVVDRTVIEQLNTTNAERIRFYATIDSPLNTEQTEGLTPKQFKGTSDWMRVDAYTQSLSESEYEFSFSASFSAIVTYDDGSTKLVSAQKEATPRSVLQVAQEALVDKSVTYSPDAIIALQTICQTLKD